jgi:hypothetical protein
MVVEVDLTNNAPVSRLCCLENLLCYYETLAYGRMDFLK